MSSMSSGSGQKKADVILTKVDQLTQQAERISQQTASVASKVDGLSNTAKTASTAEITRQGKENCEKILAENAALRQELLYMSVQIENVYTELAKLIRALSDEVASLKERPAGAAPDFNIDDLASRVAEKIIIPQTVNPVAEIDADALAEKVAQKLPAGGAAVDTDELGAKIVQNMYIPSAVVEDIDMDALAAKLAQALPAQEVISPDYIASKVAEQIVIPQTDADLSDLDVEELSRKVADKIVIPAFDPLEVTVDEDRIAYAVAEKIKSCGEQPEEVAAEATATAAIDEQALAENIAAKLNLSLSDEMIAATVVSHLADAIDSEQIADCVAKKVGSVSPEQFDVMVDDDGCDALASAVQEKLDYDALAGAVAERINGVIGAGETEIDTDELAKVLSEKLNVGVNVNEDAIADKAAAVLSNYLPEIDSDEIADKVTAGVIPAIPAAATIDYEGLSDTICRKIVEQQEESDFDIVIDDEGLNEITLRVSSEIKEEYGQRFDKVDEDAAAAKEECAKRFDKVDEEIALIKSMLLSGVVVAASNETAAAEAEVLTEEPYEEQPQEPEETLVTVSDIVTEDETAQAQEAEEAEEPEEAEEADVIDEIVDDIDETPVEGEIMPDGIPGISGGVDFASMMKYNRSFIARIIQGSDDVKRYYGEVKNALLSYKKVNSNVAWGAERFNKGRETIAKFKIRGKTLCLYLALDPNDYAVSVYHHADVSDNKSMHGTPMMVKIKSPRGVKKAIRLIDEMLAKRDGVKQNIQPRDYAAMYPYETIEELIEDGLVKDVSKK